MHCASFHAHSDTADPAADQAHPDAEHTAHGLIRYVVILLPPRQNDNACNNNSTKKVQLLF